MIVYVVCDKFSRDKKPDGVFSSKENAEKHMRNRVGKKGKFTGFEILEYEIDYMLT